MRALLACAAFMGARVNASSPSSSSEERGEECWYPDSRRIERSWGSGVLEYPGIVLNEKQAKRSY